MTKTQLNIVLLIITFLLLLSIYEFNFANSDIYTRIEQNEWVRYEDIKPRN